MAMPDNTSDAQLDFLKQVLQATANSRGNKQVIYRLLAANTDKLNQKLAELWRVWATIQLAEAEADEAKYLAAGIVNFSTVIQQFPLGDQASNIEIAITGYEVALTVFTRQAFPQQWAMTQNNLGIAYSERITGQKAQNLEIAIPCYQSALEVYTREAFPKQWAMTQNNLGSAYLKRITGQKAQNLENAIACLQLALKVRTREAFPQQWAMTQNNLGIAYCNRIRGQKAQNLEDAIACYKSALEVSTREAFPIDWAMTQNNLGIAYCNRIKGKKAQNLEDAIACYKSALEVRTREAFPEQWAMTQNNLGLAYKNRITGQKAQNLEDAIACYKSALEVRTPKAFPIDWAGTQNNLGLAYSDRIIGQKAQNVEQAIACFQKALTVRTFDAFPQNHAETLFNLGLTYKGSNQFTLAYTKFKFAIDTVESLREEIVSGDESKRKQAEEWNKLYRSMVEVCLELTNITEAIEYVERSKTRNLIEEILRRDLKTIFSVDVVSQLEQYRDEIAIGQYQIQQGKAENPTALAQHLQELRQQRNDLQDQYLPIGSSFNFEQFRKTLEKNTAIVEFYISFDRFLTFIFTRHSQQPLVLSSSTDQLYALIDWTTAYLDDYYDQPQDWRNPLTSRLQKLAEILNFNKILQQLPKDCNQLILIPHQYLHLFPLHALPLPENPGKLLFNRFSQGVRYSPSCQLLQLVQTRKRPDFTHLFAVQNPTGDLSYANIGVEVIKSYFNPADTEVLVENAATKAAIDSKPLNTYHCVHFSCHGYFNLNQPQKSALILADAYLNSAPAELNPEQHLVLDDGEVIDLHKCLTLDAIFALKSQQKLAQCRLVTLSACETGLIDFDNTSDEYIGLPSGFLVAGSPAVVSSLWKVEEVSTALLMIKFYQNLLNQMSLAVALNQAQLWLRDATVQDLRNWAEQLTKQLTLENNFKEEVEEEIELFKNDYKPFYSPYYWAAYCAIGESYI
ncbi:MAG: CHAT domain-containing protein [Moorea sp. SIO3B2]|nr:CHAT domain-containing protein [Moorena sp. SIO3B2]